MPAHLSRRPGRAAAGDRRALPRPPDARGRGRLRRAGRAGLSARRAEVAAALRGALLDPAEAVAAHRARRASRPRCWCRCSSTPRGALHAVFTERRADLRRHAGEISFPGGRRERRRRRPVDAPRCARATRRSGCRRAQVELLGALQPTPTFVTNYAIYPFVGLIEPGFAWVLQEREVAQVLELPLAAVRGGLRPAPARAARDAVPHRHLRDRRPPHLGRDRPHRRRPARPRSGR